MDLSPSLADDEHLRDVLSESNTEFEIAESAEPQVFSSRAEVTRFVQSKYGDACGKALVQDVSYKGGSSLRYRCEGCSMFSVSANNNRVSKQFKISASSTLNHGSYNFQGEFVECTGSSRGEGTHALHPVISAVIGKVDSRTMKKVASAVGVSMSEEDIKRVTRHTGSSELWGSQSAADWRAALDRYDDAISFVCQRKGSSALKALDDWYCKEIRGVIVARDPPCINMEELKKVMSWKITRGKWRPLLKYIEQNTASAVEANTAAAFKQLGEKNYSAAVRSLCTLRGIGVATASAVLCILAPRVFPFMSDEALETTVDAKRAYTTKSYELMQEALQSKAARLGAGWTAEDVGKCLWATIALGGTSSDDRVSGDKTGDKTTKRVRVEDSLALAVAEDE